VKSWNYHWRASPAVEQLERHIDELRTTVVRLRHEVETKQSHLGRLKILVQQRSNTIDDLRGKLEQSQQQIRQLNEEADHLATLVRMS
jgi:predicted RNase H-like nuclease (RuvC/YqgF family)